MVVGVRTHLTHDTECKQGGHEWIWHTYKKGKFSLCHQRLRLIPLQAKNKKINYVESDSEGTDNEDIFKTSKPPIKRRKVSESADEDVYEQEQENDDGTLTSYYLHNPD